MYQIKNYYCTTAFAPVNNCVYNTVGNGSINDYIFHSPDTNFNIKRTDNRHIVIIFNKYKINVKVPCKQTEISKQLIGICKYISIMIVL